MCVLTPFLLCIYYPCTLFGVSPSCFWLILTHSHDSRSLGTYLILLGMEPSLELHCLLPGAYSLISLPQPSKECQSSLL